MVAVPLGVVQRAPAHSVQEGGVGPKVKQGPHACQPALCRSDHEQRLSVLARLPGVGAKRVPIQQSHHANLVLAADCVDQFLLFRTIRDLRHRGRRSWEGRRARREHEDESLKEHGAARCQRDGSRVASSAGRGWVVILPLPCERGSFPSFLVQGNTLYFPRVPRVFLSTMTVKELPSYTEYHKEHAL